MVTARIWDWQEEHMHGIPLAGTLGAGAEPWVLRRATSNFARIAPTNNGSIYINNGHVRAVCGFWCGFSSAFLSVRKIGVCWFRFREAVLGVGRLQVLIYGVGVCALWFILACWGTGQALGWVDRANLYKNKHGVCSMSEAPRRENYIFLSKGNAFGKLIIYSIKGLAIQT